MTAKITQESCSEQLSPKPMASTLMRLPYLHDDEFHKPSKIKSILNELSDEETQQMLHLLVLHGMLIVNCSYHTEVYFTH